MRSLVSVIDLLTGKAGGESAWPRRCRQESCPLGNRVKTAAGRAAPNLGGGTGFGCGTHEFVMPGLHKTLIEVHGGSLRLGFLRGVVFRVDDSDIGRSPCSLAR